MDRGFILYPTYEVRDEEVVVQMYGKLESGETFLLESPQVPYFFILSDDVERAQELAAISVEDTDLLTLDDASVSRITVKSPKDVPSLRRALEDGGIGTYEADIRFAYRFLIDNSLTTGIAIEGDYTKGVRVDRVYREPALSPAADWQPSLKVLSIDIETDRRASKVWSISLATSDGRTEKLILDRSVDGAHCCDSEKELLQTLSGLVLEIDPDIITGWNVIDFDLKVLQRKYSEHGLSWDWARCARDCTIRSYKDYMRDSQADIPGRMVLDGIQLLRSSFIKLDSYTLESAAREFVGDGKLFSGKGRFDDIRAAYDDDPAALLDYNLKDAQLVLDILEETGVIDLTIRRSLMTGMALDRVKASIASLDMLYIPRLRARGHVAPTSGYTAKEQPITGGFVMESKPGIYDYVIVCDFKSLYPSVMRTINIDPLAFDPHADKDSSDAEHVVAENGAAFSQELGILPGILQELWAERERARGRGDELARYAIKILMNSFFGVLASPNCRFFSMSMANAITHTCQHVIKLTAERLRGQGYDVIYGDTDSIFIDLNIDDGKKAFEVGKTIESDVNAFLDEYTKERYKRESFLELEFEKTFERFMMPRTRSGEGSKKRYAGLVRKDGNEEIDFTGLEFVRRDWTELAKEFQLTILDDVFHRRDPAPFIRKFTQELRDGKHDDLLVYRKALRKGIDEYTKTTPPHVKAARLLDEIDSPIIEYVMTVDGPEPVSKQQHSIDYEHYVEKQLQPIADGVLDFYDTSFRDVLLGTKQKGLFDF